MFKFRLANVLELCLVKLTFDKRAALGPFGLETAIRYSLHECPLCGQSGHWFGASNVGFHIVFVQGWALVVRAGDKAELLPMLVSSKDH